MSPQGVSLGADHLPCTPLTMPLAIFMTVCELQVNSFPSDAVSFSSLQYLLAYWFIPSDEAVWNGIIITCACKCTMVVEALEQQQNSLLHVSHRNSINLFQKKSEILTLYWNYSFVGQDITKLRCCKKNCEVICYRSSNPFHPGLYIYTEKNQKIKNPMSILLTHLLVFSYVFPYICPGFQNVHN